MFPGLHGQGASLGNATFTVAANTQPFQQGLQQAQQQAQQFNSNVAVAMRGVGASVQQGSRNAGMGLLMLSQTIDDAQYGFRAIVNNIPGVVMALGGSAGLAGALGISAVAVNTWINHWDDAREVFGGFVADVKAAFPVLEGLGNALSGASASVFVSASNLSPMRAGWGDIGQITEARERERAEAEGRTRRAAAAAGRVDAVRNEEERYRGRAFTATLSEYGPERLRAEMEARAGIGTRKLTEEQKAKIQEGINLAIADAMTGKFGPGLEQNFGKGFAKAFGEREGEAERQAWMKDIQRINKELKRDKEKEADDARRKRIEGLQDRQEAIEEERKKLHQREQERRLNRVGIHESGMDYVKAVQTGDGEVRKKQLETQKKMDEKLGQIRDELKKERRARFQ